MSQVKPIEQIKTGNVNVKTGEEEKGMMWVKASETLDRLPLEKFIPVRDNVGCPRMGNFFKDEDDNICFSVIGTDMYETFIMQTDKLWSIEWLDESAPDQSSQIKLLQEQIRKQEGEIEISIDKLREKINQVQEIIDKAKSGDDKDLEDTWHNYQQGMKYALKLINPTATISEAAKEALNQKQQSPEKI